jgi:hypothetical protein
MATVENKEKNIISLIWNLPVETLQCDASVFTKNIDTALDCVKN